jgi:hypothetical protein
MRLDDAVGRTRVRVLAGDAAEGGSRAVAVTSL